MTWTPSKYPLIVNPYESFMKRHLQHYGYYTGRNMAISRFGFEPKRGYKNEDWDESDTESENDSESSLNRLKGKIELKNKTNKINDNYKWWLKDNGVFGTGLKDSEYQREPKWPVEMQVLPEKIKHIDVASPEPEPIYLKTGTEETPMGSVESKQHKTVFLYNPVNCGYFIRSRVGGNREGCPRVTIEVPEIEQESTLIFESRFESGNLMKAVKISDTEYELYLRYDLYTTKHTQWFYFQVKNAKPNVQYRFTLCNFLKSDSLYNMGMKPLMYSETDARTKNIGWRRVGQNIKYYKNSLRSEDENGNSRSLYSLTWTCEFANANDTIYFAHCYPYTYSDLQEYIKKIQEDPVKNKFCKVKILCRTLAENLVHLITITNPPSSESENANKKAVVLSARVHPGETNSSWMMKGFLDFLLGNSADAKLLRDNFVFKIVPMLNPDGVIIGNYRCSLTGRDLNRNYKTVLKEAFPSIWHTREMIKKVMEEREVILYCDLHGHSRRHNVFIYGCHNNNNPKRRFQEHVFPMIMSKIAKNHFSYKSCKFKIQKSKQGTGRIVMWNMGIVNSFTMEATFSGSTLGQKAGFHFNTRDLEDLGYLFCDSLLDYCDPDQTKCKIILKEVETMMRERIRPKLESQGINVDQVDLIDDFDSLNFGMDEDEQETSDDVGSDSSVDDGLPLHLEHFAKLRQRKKRKVKARKTSMVQPSSKSSTKETQPSKLVVSNASTTNVSAQSAAPPNSTVFTNDCAVNNTGSNLGASCVEATAPNANRSTSSYNSEVKEKKEKSSLSSAANSVSSVKQNETLMKETEKKLLRPLLGNNATLQLQQFQPHPKSAKMASSAFPIFIADRSDERTKKLNPNAIQLQLDTESAQYQTDPNFLTFRYTLPSEVQFTAGFNPHHHLCEHHRKKLSDLFLLKHLEKGEDGSKAESDGNASDDEADPIDDFNDEFSLQIQQAKPRARPTLEEYVKKHVFNRNSDSSNVTRRQRRTKTSHSFGTKIRVNEQNQPFLEIRNLQKEEAQLQPQLKPQDGGDADSVKLDSKTALDFMPKYVLKQINERRQLNLNGLSSTNNNNNNNAVSSATIMNPYYVYNAKNPNEIIESAARDLNRKGTKNSKLQAHLIQAIQQKQLVHPQNSSSLSNQQNKNNSRSSASLIGANDSASTVSTNQHQNKVNDEILASFSPAMSNASGGTTLFSSAFVTMNSQLKSQYEKITSRANSTILPNTNSVKPKLSR